MFSSPRLSQALGRLHLLEIVLVKTRLPGKAGELKGKTMGIITRVALFIFIACVSRTIYAQALFFPGINLPMRQTSQSRLLCIVNVLSQTKAESLYETDDFLAITDRHLALALQVQRSRASGAMSCRKMSMRVLMSRHPYIRVDHRAHLTALVVRW